MNSKFLQIAALSLVLGASSCQKQAQSPAPISCNASLTVLGTAQDAGKPQIGHSEDPAWSNPKLLRMASSLGLIDNQSGLFTLFDATPDIKYQLYSLEKYSGKSGLKLSGVFLTHGHMGHYLGLAQLGREAMGAKSIPVYAMPKMANFLNNNGPWDLLVRLNNIDINTLTNGVAVSIGNNISVKPFLVPHRGEYTETAGFIIKGASKSAVYLPDIDSWEEWGETQLEDMIAANDYLFVDGTFYSGNELAGRDMTKIPHPTITHTMKRLKSLNSQQRAKIWFTHLNHSNPAHDEHTTAYQDIKKAGYKIAKAGQKICLD